MTPRQAKAARAMLGLDLKEVCKLADVGQRTLTEFEAGKRAINSVTEAKIKGFYISRGISFGQSSGEYVSFLSAQNDLAADLPVRDMVEYVDVVGIEPIMTKIAAIGDLLDQLVERPTASQAILRYILQKKNWNQKDLAAYLDCTTAFISAVYIGKKAISAPMAAKCQQLLSTGEFEISQILARDKAMRKIDAQLRECVNAYLQTLGAFSNPPQVSAPVEA